MRKKFTFWNSAEGSVMTMDKNIFEIQRFATISNYTSDTVITGTEDADNIGNYDADNVTINALGGNDTIQNGAHYGIHHGGNSVIINAGDGNDTIYNGSSYSRISNVTINAGAGDDSIYNECSANVMINAGEGNDSVYNGTSSSDTSINSGTGSDSISNLGSNVTINADAGDDSISNYGDNVWINADDGDNYIFNDGKNVTIDSGDGHDLIKNSDYGRDANNVIINTGAGNDTISNSIKKVRINAGEGNDFVHNGGENVTINTGAGNDSVHNGGENVTINTGAGNDSVHNDGENVTINTGAGNDSISITGKNNTITGGTGDDVFASVFGQYLVYQYSKDDGNDLIYGFDSSDTLIISGSSYATSANDTDVIVRVGDAAITLAGAADKTLHIDGTLMSGASLNNTADGKHITGTACNDTLYNSGKNLSIDSGSYDDIIANSGENVTIYGGTENDSVTNSGENVKIFAGDGEDSIINRGANVTIYGGAGSDRISNEADSVEIFGGSADDSIKNTGKYAYINGGDGNNTVSNSGEYAAIIIAGNGNNTVSNTGKYANINGGDGNDSIYNSGTRSYVNAGNGNNNIINSERHNAGDLGSDTKIISGSDADNISNYSSNVTIESGAGDDTITNNASSVQVYGEAGNDYISLGSVKENTVEGGTGNDTIYFTSSSVSGSNVYRYTDGDGNDKIYNFGSSDTLLIAAESFATVPLGNDIIVNVGEGSIHLYDVANKNVTVKIDNSKMIYGTEGADSINNTVRGAIINALGGNDTIWNYAENVKIDASVGDDYISSYGSNVTITAGEGNDSIYNDWYGKNVTISGGAGNDTISNSGENVSINGGEGNDHINIYGTDITINGGKGNDTINVEYPTRSVEVAVYQYSNGDGNDVIEGFRAQDTLQIIDGTINDWVISDEDVVVKIGEGSIRLKGARYTHVTVLDASGQLSTINNAWSTITGTANDDHIYNTANNMTISALGGNDTIYNSGGGSDSKIYSGVGNDDIENWGANVQIFTGEGNDTIYNQGDNTTINGGEGDDFISNYASNVKIDGGSGDDTIKNRDSQVTINAGDGNDSINNRYSDNVITLGAGKDTITLDFTAGTDTWTVTLSDFSKEDIITLEDSVKAISFDETAKTLKIGDRWIAYLPNNKSAATWKVEDSAISYMPEQNLQFVLAADGKSITCTETTTTPALTITGLKSDLTVVDGKIDGITLEDKQVIVSATVLDGKDVTITEGYELALSDKVKAPEKSVATWSVENGTAKYKDGDTTAGYVVEDGKIVYTPASVGETLITIEGLSATATTDGIILDGITVKLSASVLDKQEVTISEGYTLALDEKVSRPIIGDPSWSIEENVATYKAGDTTAGYILEDNKISYAEAKVGENLVTVRGVKSLDGLTLTGKVVTIAESSLNEVDVTIEGKGYTLALATGVTSPVINNPSWNVTNGTATCQGNRTAGYMLENNTIVYNAAVTDETLITVTGLKDTAQVSGISLNGKTVTLSEEVLDKNKEVTINTGYTLALADDVTKTTTGAGSWSIAGNNATYKAGDVTAGYALTDNKISYTDAKVGENLVTVSGVKSIDGLTLKDKVVTVAESSLDEKEITITNGYTLALASNVTKPTETKPAWTVTNGTATYRLSGMTAGYTLDNGKIVYKEAVEGETQITVSGLKNTAITSDISLSNGTLTIANAAISTGTITVTAADSVKKVSVGGAGKFTFDGQTFSVDTSAEFTLDENKVSGYKVTGNSAAHLNNTYSNLTITGGNSADVISLGSGSQNTVIGGGGNDTLYSNGNSNVFHYTSGAGNDVIYNLGTNDTLEVASGSISSIYAEKGGDVIVKVGGNNVTLKNRAGQTINVKNPYGSVTTQSYTYTEPSSTTQTTTTTTPPSTPSSPSTSSTPSTPSTPSTSSSSSSSSGSPSSSASSNSGTSSPSTSSPSNSSSSSSSSGWSSSSSGGSTTRTTTTSPTTTRSSSSSGGSTSWSTSSSSSSSASSGSSSSTTQQTQATSTPIQKSEDGSYDYTGGNKKVSNYTSEDKVKLSSDFAGIDVSGNNFVIKSSSGALTLENVRDQVINVTDSEGNTAAYVYMASGGGDIDGSSLDTFEVIVGSETESNYIKAGNGGSSLVGGGGDNTLQGGSGQDTFKYSAGTNVITNYQSGEVISFAASYTGWTTDGNDLVINAAEGSLRIIEATNKLVEIAGADGNVIAHVYKAENYEGIIDGRVFDKFEVIVGSDNLSNQIFANEVGSSLWGGRGNSNDDLYGNIGTDEYIYAYGNGQDNIYQAGSEDTVNLLNISLSQITGAEITENGVNIQFTDGGSLNISGQVGAFKLEGQVYRADYQNKTWS